MWSFNQRVGSKMNLHCFNNVTQEAAKIHGVNQVEGTRIPNNEAQEMVDQ
jgi:hypothetical protein